MKTKTETRQQGPQPNKKELTFLEHLLELRRRLFWVVGTVVVVSALAFPLQNQILAILTMPLDGQKLYYLTPVGGFNLVLKLCMYVGVLAAIPLAMYHLYKYLEPLVGSKRGPIMRYTILSAVLALCGIGFAYFVSLPAALAFLTGIDVAAVQAMLTADAYLSFVMMYLLAGALLFQLPLILLIINTVTPLKPTKLLNTMRYAIVAAFILAAILSPTPDIVNQTLLAAPMIIMYALGVGLVWWKNRTRVAPVALVAQHTSADPTVVLRPVGVPAVAAKTPVLVDDFRRPVQLPKPAPTPAQKALPARSIDGIVGIHRGMPLLPAA